MVPARSGEIDEPVELVEAGELADPERAYRANDWAPVGARDPE